ncbi:MAG TPA: hypothetical protein VFA65_19295 [Bryobacteraceae bacterium]|nr:hypothetical protein [Bryobacteraceae bacterium]
MFRCVSDFHRKQYQVTNQLQRQLSRHVIVRVAVAYANIGKHMRVGILGSGFIGGKLGYVEPFSLLVAQLAYNGSDSRELSYRFQYVAK